MMIVENVSIERSSIACLDLIGNLALSDFLQLAIQITNIVNQIHQQQRVYKRLNPYNITFDRTTNQVYFVGFNDPVEQSPVYTSIERELAYISPEQTGRMNHPIDYRTDFYSLGVTLYELLTGHLPFWSDDLVELVHSHMAQAPLPPYVLRPDIPLVVSHIILKLLSKNAEERYQSADSLAADLEECWRQWQTTARIEPFTPGLQDFGPNNNLRLSQKLYDREPEIETLLSAFRRVRQGDSEMVFVSGYTGVGKSALVQTVFKSTPNEQGYFTSGKFDQYQCNVPYAALIQAFQSLIQQILTEDEAQISVWKKELLAVLGPNAQIIIDVIPDIELIIGPQPAVAELSSLKGQNRFNFVFQNFIRAFIRPGQPLVIFLDDLQWADTASLTLLQSLPDTLGKNLLLIGAYRDNEVPAEHPLKLMMAELDQRQRTFIHLSPLSSEAINQLLAGTFSCSPDQTEHLANVALTKSGGNPLFINEFLKLLHSEGLVHFDRDRGWRWDLSAIQEQDISADIANFLVAKVQKLKTETQQLLNLAACIGREFDPQMLTALYGQAIAVALNESVGKGLVFVSGEKPDCYKFTHDQIQQACYLLSSDEHRRETHYQIGQLLLQNTPSDEQKQEVFDIVHHLNQSIQFASDEERAELAQLNLIAGQKAKSAVAYSAAFDYLQKGLELAGYSEGGWQHQYQFNLVLHQEAAEAAYLCGDFSTMETLVGTILEQARTPLDKVKSYEIKIQAYQAQHQPLKAIETALVFLKELGVRLPSPTKFQIGLALVRIRLALLGKQPDDLSRLPPMTDPSALSAMRIMAHAQIPTYVTTPNLLPLLLAKMISLSLKYGNAAESAVAYNGFGLILCGVVGDIKTGYQFSQFAQRLIKAFEAKEYEVMIEVIFNALIRHWQDHRRETIAPLQAGYRKGLETGDLVYASYGLYLGFFTAFVIGSRNLSELETDMALVDDTIAKLKQKMVLYYHRLQWQGILNLLDRSDDPCSLVGELYDERKALAIYHQTNDFTGISAVHSQKMMLLYLFRRYDEAAECAVTAGQYIESMMGAPEFSRFYFYDSLTWLALCRNAPQNKRKQFLKKVAKNQKTMKKWAAHAPHNYAHKFYLIEAERARVLAKDGQAKDHYDRAISLAGQYSYLNVEALAYELAGGFYHDRGQTRLAQIHLRESRQVYAKWGALAKIRDLEAQYPQIFSQTPPSSTISPAEETEEKVIKDLDSTSIAKAAQALSDEQALDELISTLMKIVIENAGAQKGYLLFKQKEAWEVVAAGVICSTGVDVTYPVPEPCNLPTSVINYVIRTKKNVVLPDESQVNLFGHDAYFTTRALPSVLCTPLLNQNRLSGVLYLENRLTRASFTRERVAILKIISAHAATALEHAWLYSPISRKTTIEILEDEFTEGEKSVFEMLVRGLTNKQISEELCLSDKTVRNRLSIIYQKLGVDNRTGAVFYAIKRGWIQVKKEK